MKYELRDKHSEVFKGRFPLSDYAGEVPKKLNRENYHTIPRQEEPAVKVRHLMRLPQREKEREKEYRLRRKEGEDCCTF